jgi:ABC-type transport system involved in multi-copper enzyme maturation permease subunit
MPVYEQGYEAYTGVRKPLGRRWLPLFRDELLPYFRKRRFVFLLLLAMIPWLYGIALTFLHTQLGDAQWAKELAGQLPQVDEALVAKLMANGFDLFLLLVVCIWVGSGLVARDRRDRTLEVFLGRGLGAGQYLWAKGAALGLFLLLFSLLPTLVLVVFQVGLTGDAGWIFVHSRVLWGSLLYTVVGLGSLTVFVLALSSLGRSPRVVGLVLVGIVFFGDAACGILYGITRNPAIWFFSVAKELEVLACRCLGAPPPHFISLPLWLSALFFAGLAALSAGVLFLRFARRGVLQ